MVLFFCFFKKSQLIIAYHYIIFLLRLRVTLILYEFVPTIKFESEMIQSTYLHIFTDLKSKIQFGSVDLEFWVFNWYVLDLKVDLRNATLNGGFKKKILEANQSNQTALKTHNFQHDISPVCMELNDGAKVFMKSHLQIYVQTVNLSREIAVWIQRYSIVIDKDFGPIAHSSGSWILFTFHIRISPTLFLNSFFYNVLCGTQHFTTTYEKSKQFPKPWVVALQIFDPLSFV